jgi:hypothetical protein
VELGQVERAQAEQLEADLRRDGRLGEHYTVEKVLRIWCRLELFDTTSNVDDYTGAGLLWRDDLAEIIDRSPEPLRTALTEAVAEGDERFRSMSDEDTHQLLSRYFKVERRDGWWWRRIPKHGAIRDQLHRRAPQP